jgi:hypothetical protein
MLKAYGRWNPWVHAYDARTHVRDLMAADMGIRLIARAAGVEPSRITHLLYGRSGNPPPSRIRPAYSAAILAVEPAPRRVPAIGAQRRLGALAAIGHTQTALAIELGWNQRRLNQVFLTDGTLERRTHDAIAAMYERLSMTLPPRTTRGEKYAASKAQNTAARHGYAPPMCWDVETIDDPEARPHGARTGRAVYDSRDLVDSATVLRILAGEVLPANTAERDEVVRRWKAAGKPEAALCARMGWGEARYGREERSA